MYEVLITKIFVKEEKIINHNPQSRRCYAAERPRGHEVSPRGAVNRAGMDV